MNDELNEAKARRDQAALAALGITQLPRRDDEVESFDEAGKRGLEEFAAERERNEGLLRRRLGGKW